MALCLCVGAVTSQAGGFNPNHPVPDDSLYLDARGGLLRVFL